jgi:predicted enzyme related to lactoylglutathione lyase
MPTIVHFDISTDNPERAKKFYEELFDWKIEVVPGMQYYLIQTTDSNGKQGVSGGMARREKPEQKITNFIGVSSIDEYIDKVEMLGGKVIKPKTPIPEWGFIAVCLDTENNTFGLWEEDKNAKM